MLNFGSIRGIRSLRSIQSIRKNNESDINLLKLYMLEKEKIRLVNDKAKAELRLEFINNRLKEIDEYFKSTMKSKVSTASEESNV